ncbi:MAG: 2-oxo acid dehydrogenase subunit E2 [Proteobacteria bacterium]|nr:2-oxo acid dehydrogenase subunit E2 [Pseudomonadota bacterium]
MPALSPTMEDGNLAKWLVKVGDRVSAGDLIAEIETDKAVMEVEAVDDGVIGKLTVAEGSEGVPVNTVIAVLLEDGESASDIAETEAAASIKSPEASSPSANGDVLINPSALRLAEEEGVDIHSVPGTGPHGRVTKGDVISVLERGIPNTVRTEPVEGHGGLRSRASTSSARTVLAGDRLFASPLARKLSEESNYALADIPGSGPAGRIIKADVDAFVPTAKPSGSSLTTSVVVTGDTPFEEVRLSTMRKTIARRMTESKQTVPHFYLTIDVEIDRLLDVRKDLNEVAEEGTKLSVNDFIIRAAGMALLQFPDANVQFGGDTLRRYTRADVAVAVAIDGGLITPIIKGANLKGVASISSEMKELAGRAREGKLLPEEYQGGTIAISNLGMFGVKEFLAVINPPQASILAIGAGEKRPIVKNDELAIATMMSVTMACDHRAMDGAVGAQYLQVFKSLLEHPVRLLV